MPADISGNNQKETIHILATRVLWRTSEKKYLRPPDKEKWRRRIREHKKTRPKERLESKYSVNFLPAKPESRQLRQWLSRVSVLETRLIRAPPSAAMGGFLWSTLHSQWTTRTNRQQQMVTKELKIRRKRRNWCFSTSFRCSPGIKDRTLPALPGDRMTSPAQPTSSTYQPQSYADAEYI